MKIDKAIVTLTKLLEEEHYYPTGRYQSAIQLGIKALKRVKAKEELDKNARRNCSKEGTT